MSRQSGMPGRALTLTEELERLEQSITLTLQEIDANFSKAHRIVTSSILPIVEQYAKSSDAVWEGSKFWKQFFEASANVSLSSYEEPAEEDATSTYQETDTTALDAANEARAAGAGDMTATPGQERADNLDDSSILESPSLHAARITPRREAAEEPSFAEYPSPYETLKQEMTTSDMPAGRTTRQKGKAPTTPGQSRPVFNPPDSTPAAQSSPFLPASMQRPATGRRNPDPLLHRVLDKNYRIQATPHATHRQDRITREAGAAASASTHDPMLDSSPFSPQLAAPQLRSEIFGSPVITKLNRERAQQAIPRTPGISVQKSQAYVRHRNTAPGEDDSTRRTLFSNPSTQKAKHITQTPRHTYQAHDYSIDSDDDDLNGLSPPKTLQFHVPLTATRQQIMQTPAREASKRIVEDLLYTAGLAPGVDDVTSTLEELQVRGDVDEDGEIFWDDDEVGESGRMRGGVGRALGEEDSPSVVRVRRQGEGGEDDTF